MPVSQARIDVVVKMVVTLAGGPEPVCRDIVCEAARYFEHCPDDFCLQMGHEEGLIFGGTNRLIWRPERGYRPDPGYCTERFLEHAAQLEPGGA